MSDNVIMGLIAFGALFIGLMLGGLMERHHGQWKIDAVERGHARYFVVNKKLEWEWLECGKLTKVEESK